MSAQSDLEVVAFHTPFLFDAEEKTYICAGCSGNDAGGRLSLVVWPCAERARVGHAVPHPSNALLPVTS